MLLILTVVDFDFGRATWPTLVRVRAECSCAYDAYAPDAFVERSSAPGGIISTVVEFAMSVCGPGRRGQQR